MTSETVARRYATAVFALAKEAGGIEAVGRSLGAVRAAIEGDDDARRFFVSPVIDRAEKAKVVAAVFEGKVDEIVLHTVLLLVRKRREALLAPIVTAFDALALADTGKEPLEITSARPLAPKELERMVARLSRVYQRAFEVRQTVDPSLLGGVRITLGDRRIDGTIAGRLDELARELFAKH